MFPNSLLKSLLLFQLTNIGLGRSLHENENVHDCGYKSCNPVKDGMLNVHIIAHTHNDVGWVKTVKEYYDQEVSKILPSVVKSLLEDVKAGGNRKFIYVEMAFLKRWWDDIDSEQKDIVRDLVNSGRLEITLGGWSMVDEATPYYIDIIDQHTLGFEFIRKNFGECGRPRVGWQIDPFGHSREVASIFNQFGFDGLFVGRIDFQDKKHREQTKTMEFMWKTSDSLETNSELFTGVMANVYWPPPGYCWDQFCYDTQLIQVDEWRKERMVQTFVDIVEKWAGNFETNHVMVAMGGDFHYMVADKWYDNLDELIEMANKKQTDGTNSKVNLLYSTPACYLYQLHSTNKTWPTKSDDFFPYAHRPHSFWTGFYTSRPNFKFLVRKAGAFLQGCKQIATLSMVEKAELDIKYLKEAMAIAQHHDAVSGTEKQYVVEDYTRLLMNGMGYCRSVVQKAYNKLLPVTPDFRTIDLQFCDDLDLDECKATYESDQFSIIIYNPLAHSYSYHVRIPVQDRYYQVFNELGDEIEFQTLEISEETINIPRRFSRTSGLELVFKVDLPPLGYTSAFVNTYEPELDSIDPELIEEEIIALVGEGIGPEPYISTEEIIENEFYSISVDRKTGHISRIWNKVEDAAVAMQQNFYYYVGYEGFNFTPQNQASGAYIFRPTKQRPTPVSDQAARIVSYKGSQVQEIRQVFCEWVSQVIRLYDGKPYIELEWTVGPLPSKHRTEGKEVVTRYMTDMKTDGEFYTDLNGRETLKRKRNYRETWNFDNTEPVSGNYYPVTSRASLKDERRNLQLTVLVDRSEGASSIEDGNLEIMVHRRTFYDDSLGVGEPLTEFGPGRHGIVARGRHLLLLNKIPNAAAAYRRTYQQFYMQPLIAFSTTDADVTDWLGLYRTKWSGMTKSLPPNINVLTLERWVDPRVATKYTAFLLRLEHIFEKFEDDRLATPELVELQELLCEATKIKDPCIMISFLFRTVLLPENKIKPFPDDNILGCSNLKDAADDKSKCIYTELFTPFEVIEAVELTLGANAKLKDLDKLKWRSAGERQSRYKENSIPKENPLVIELAPMQIRTFQINARVSK